jgi:hypothetical protein
MCDNNMITEYIYLLRTREFVNAGEKIYKVGRTTKENYTRFNQYPNGSVLVFQMTCNNSKNMESQIINSFKARFKHIPHLGNEWFEGDYKIMMEIIYSTIKNENEEETENDDNGNNNDDFHHFQLYEKISHILRLS